MFGNNKRDKDYYRNNPLACTETITVHDGEEDYEVTIKRDINGNIIYVSKSPKLFGIF